MTNEERAELDRLRQLERDEALPIAGRAWNAIKKADDNEWIDLPVDMKGKLTHLAEKALGGQSEQEGDYAPVGFFAKVRELRSNGIELDARVGAFDREASQSDRNRRVGLSSRRVNEAHLNLEHFPGSDRRVGSLDRRISQSLASFDTPLQLIPGDGVEARPGRRPDPDGALGTITVDHAEKSATVNINSEDNPPALKGPLPDDFPGHDVLHDAGINTYGQLFKQRDSDEGLIGVPKVGPALVSKIQERLAAPTPPAQDANETEVEK